MVPLLENLIQHQPNAHGSQNKSNAHQNWMVIWLGLNVSDRRLSQLGLRAPFRLPKGGEAFKTLASVGSFPDPKRMRMTARTIIIPPPPRLKIVAKLMG